MSLTPEQVAKIELVAAETDFLPAAAAFALGMHDDNVEEAIAYLSGLAAETDGPMEAIES